MSHTKHDCTNRLRGVKRLEQKSEKNEIAKGYEGDGVATFGKEKEAVEENDGLPCYDYGASM